MVLYEGADNYYIGINCGIRCIVYWGTV